MSIGERYGVPVRVAYDVTACIVGTTGIARHNEEVGCALAARGVDVRRFAIGRGSIAPPPGTRWTRIPLRIVHKAWAVARVPRIEWLTADADVVHTDLVVPPGRHPVVVTVYDLDALERPELHPQRSVSNQRAMLASLDRAAAVLAISQATADALVRHGVPPDRVTVTPSGLTPLPDAEPARLAGDAPYVLHVGSLHHRKGLDVLLAAAAHLPGDVHVVLAGPDDNAAADLHALAECLGLDGRIHWEGRVSDARLASLYRGAAVVCAPSRAEGFGLPVLEALEMGTPVVASSIPAFAEVAGDAALFVPPGDVDALADALAEALSGDAAIVRRVAVGRQRAALFTWDACAAKTIEAYERAMA